ncbi:amidase [Ottowia thiooxydans]|uniref:Asp-tRNA(Asn)/Glu-tRNA(Gln) amidotransferase A subunit family amidase n=1 Tax=Ottowia thiooxydans TaxID=219182 RepID=A0ABV2Q708_9BURK
MGLVSTLLPFRDAVVRFRAGSCSPREYLEQAIEHVTQAEPTLEVFAHLDLESARKLADASTERYRQGQVLSPIDGMPMGIKDIIDTSDMPTQMGSEIYAGWRPMADAACVQALRLGGALSLGKTRSTEFAIGRATITRNPHDTGRTPGGSSSGTAAGVASGMFCAGLGTQTQGSIVRPASYCGVVGYKPTWGALPLNGVHSVSTSHDHLGVIAESVESAWQVARWIAQKTPILFRHGLNGAPDHELPPKPVRRLAVLRTAGYSELDEGSLAAFEGQLQAWRAKGIKIVEPCEDKALSMFCAEVEQIPAASMSMVAHEMQWPYLSYLENHGKLVSEKIHHLVQQGAGVDRLQYERLLRLRTSLGVQVQALGEYYDAFVLPAASGVAPVGLENTGSRTLVVYSSFLGLPACSLPLLQVNGLPLGVQFMGSRNGDYRLLGHAQWLMTAQST